MRFTHCFVSGRPLDEPFESDDPHPKDCARDDVKETMRAKYRDRARFERYVDGVRRREALASKASKAEASNDVPIGDAASEGQAMEDLR